MESVRFTPSFEQEINSGCSGTNGIPAEVVGYSVEPANLIQRIGWLVRTLPVVRKKQGQSDVVEPSSLLAITLK